MWLGEDRAYQSQQLRRPTREGDDSLSRSRSEATWIRRGVMCSTPPHLVEPIRSSCVCTKRDCGAMPIVTNGRQGWDTRSCWLPTLFDPDRIVEPGCSRALWGMGGGAGAHGRGYQDGARSIVRTPSHDSVVYYSRTTRPRDACPAQSTDGRNPLAA